MDDRLARLAEHPGLAAAMQHVPRTPAARMFLYGITLVAGGRAIVTVGLPLAIVLGSGFAALGLAVISVGVFFVRAPLERVLAMIVPESSGAVRPSRYVTLARGDGLTREYRMIAGVAARVTAGDQGVAYVKAGFLLDFQQLR
ncbi:MAG: hypothetical protein JWP01_707 [Myxococcales bacterium]|nr:hypothetical protein [Myxococcales bacterium]